MDIFNLVERCRYKELKFEVVTTTSVQLCYSTVIILLIAEQVVFAELEEFTGLSSLSALKLRATSTDSSLLPLPLLARLATSDIDTMPLRELRHLCDNGPNFLYTMYPARPTTKIKIPTVIPTILPVDKGWLVRVTEKCKVKL